MSKFKCDYPRCEHEFYSSEEKNVIKCPVCDRDVLNKDRVITTDNFLWIESMFENIQRFGKGLTLKMIDKNYSNAITRARVRNIYFQTLEILEK